MPISSRVVVSGAVHLILKDGASLAVNGGIQVAPGNSLTIYAQSTGDTMGSLTSQDPARGNAAIGGNDGQAAGTITINGGNVTATCPGNYDNRGAAAIGGGQHGKIKDAARKIRCKNRRGIHTAVQNRRQAPG